MGRASARSTAATSTRLEETIMTDPRTVQTLDRCDDIATRLAELLLPGDTAPVGYAAAGDDAADEDDEEEDEDDDEDDEDDEEADDAEEAVVEDGDDEEDDDDEDDDDDDDEEDEEDEEDKADQDAAPA
jgi:hypothetical protein